MSALRDKGATWHTGCFQETPRPSWEPWQPSGIPEVQSVWLCKLILFQPLSTLFFVEDSLPRESQTTSARGSQGSGQNSLPMLWIRYAKVGLSKWMQNIWINFDHFNSRRSIGIHFRDAPNHPRAFSGTATYTVPYSGTRVLDDNVILATLLQQLGVSGIRFEWIFYNSIIPAQRYFWIKDKDNQNYRCKYIFNAF